MNKIPHNSTKPATWRKALITAVACFGLTSFISVGLSVSDVDDTRAQLEKWVQTRRIISQEKQDWALGKEMLSERVKLVEREISGLREKITEAEESISEADKKRDELVRENEQLKETSTALSEIVLTLETRIGELLQRLPDPIRERVKPLSQRIPEQDKDKKIKLSLAERFQNIIGILNEVNKFNREITVTSEVRTLSDGSSAEVTVMYLGIGKAYYVNGNADIAGIGSATEDGWVWRSANDAARQIARAVAIYNNEQVARFVKLPIEIH